MFVVELIYKAPLAEIDAHLRAHMKFLNKYYAASSKKTRSAHEAWPSGA